MLEFKGFILAQFVALPRRSH